jgi:hypothetical protein
MRQIHWRQVGILISAKKVSKSIHTSKKENL